MEGKTKENKVIKWVKKNDMNIGLAVLVFLLVLLIIFLVAIAIYSKQTNETTIEQNDDKMVTLQEMYHENTEDIVIKANVITDGCMKWDFMRDAYKYIDYKAINAYLERNDLIEWSDLSDERLDLEVDAFVYIFKDDLMIYNDLKELVIKREFLENEMRKTEGKIHE